MEFGYGHRWSTPPRSPTGGPKTINPAQRERVAVRLPLIILCEARVSPLIIATAITLLRRKGTVAEGSRRKVSRARSHSLVFLRFAEFGGHSLGCRRVNRMAVSRSKNAFNTTPTLPTYQNNNNTLYNVTNTTNTKNYEKRSVTN